MDTLKNILSAYQGNGKPYFVLRMYTHCLTCWSVLHGVVDYNYCNAVYNLATETSY